MKKGLLTVLLASLVLVGCQNYDDQFDDLNAQISALKSQVDGLSSLSGQVSSLSGTISGLQAGVSAAQAAATAAGASADAATAAGNAATAAATAAGTAATAAGTEATAATAAANAATAAVNGISATDLSGLEASLAKLASDLAAVQASLATAATAAAVTTLQAEIDAIELDLDSLLATSNIYTGTLIISSATQLDVAAALGNKVNIINGGLTISPTTTMDMVKLQTVIDRVFTVNGAVAYTAASASATMPTFQKMVSAGNITVKASGDIRFDKLITAGDITLNDTWESKVGVIHFGAMTTAGTLTTGSTAHTVDFNQATEVHLTALPYYNGSTATQALTIKTKKGSVVDLSALDDVTAAGTASNLTLTLDGPASFTSTNLKSYSGELDFTNVATVNVSGFSGNIDVNAGVENLTITGGVQISIDGATDLETATINVINDDDPLDTASDNLKQARMQLDAVNLSFVSSDLTTVAISGKLNNVTFDGDTSTLTEVTSITISAAMNDLDIDNLDDLTTLNVTGASIHNVTIEDSAKIGTVNLNHTYNSAYSGGAAAHTSSNLTVKNNAELTSLTYKGSKVKTLTVTGNDKLTTVDFTGLTTVGAAADVDIWDNDLTASRSEDTTDGTAAGSDVTLDGVGADTADKGTYTTTSGMATLKTYLDAVRDQAAAAANVYFDTVTLSGSSESGTFVEANSGAAITYTSNTATNVTAVLYKVKEGSDGTATKVAQKAKRGFLVKSLDAGGAIQFTVNGVPLFDTTTNGTGTVLDINGQNKDLDVAAVNSAINTTRATNANVTLLAKRGGQSTGIVTLKQYTSGGVTTSILGQKYTTGAAANAAVSTTNYGIGTDELFKLTVGTNSVTASVGDYSTTATTLNGIASLMELAWAGKYGYNGTASASALATVTTADGGVINITMLQEDSAGYLETLDFSVTPGSAATGLDTSTNGLNVDYTIGATNLESDDKTQDTSIIVTIESTVGGVDENTISSLTTSTSDASSTTIVEMTTDYTVNTAWSAGTYESAQVERIDVRSAEDTVGGTANTAAILWSRTHWLGS